MTIYKEARSFFQLALPVIVAELAYGGSSFVAVMMTARLGTHDLAASAIALSIFVTVMSLCWGVISIVSVFVAHHHGAGESKQIGVAVRHGFILTVFLSAIAMLIFWFAPFLIRHLGQENSVATLSTVYLHAILWSVFPDLGVSLLEQFLFGIRRPIFAMVSALGLLTSTVVLSYVFVFGKFGIPAMGLVGLGWARTVSAVVVFALMIVYMMRHGYFKQFELFSRTKKYSKAIIMDMLKLGSPIGFSAIIEVSCCMVLAVFMGWIEFGHEPIAQASYQIVLQFVEIGMIVVFGLAQASAITVGSVIGVIDRDRLRRVIMVSLALPVFFVLLSVCMYWFFPNVLISLDLNIHHIKNVHLVEVAASFLIIAGFFQLFDSVRLITAGVLRAFRDTQYLMWQSMICFWLVALPAGYYLAFVQKLEGRGLMLGLVLGAMIGAVIAVCRLYSVFNRNELPKAELLDSTLDLL